METACNIWKDNLSGAGPTIISNLISVYLSQINRSLHAPLSPLNTLFILWKHAVHHSQSQTSLCREAEPWQEWKELLFSNSGEKMKWEWWGVLGLVTGKGFGGDERILSVRYTCIIKGWEPTCCAVLHWNFYPTTEQRYLPQAVSLSDQTACAALPHLLSSMSALHHIQVDLLKKIKTTFCIRFSCRSRLVVI